MTLRIAVSTTSLLQLPAAKKLASQLNLDLIENIECANGATHAAYDYVLLLTDHYLGIQKICDRDSKTIKPFYIDFLSQKSTYRRQQASLRKEALARAIGKKPAENTLIIDATAGLGRDSFILASLGFHVTMLERSPILHALLHDGLKRAANDPSICDIASRLTLYHADANAWLLTQSERPAVIYLDPMFPTRQKQAAVKKDMAIVKDLLKNDDEAANISDKSNDELLTLALTCSTYRVVVKRPRIAAPLAHDIERQPDFALIGKSSRFDVYQIVPTEK